MDMKACRDGRYKRSKQCYCISSRVSCLSTLLIWRSKHAIHLMLCLLTLSTLVFVDLTQHLIQSTMRWENCIDSVNIDSIQCIRDPCLVSTVSTYIVLIVWLKSPESQLSKTFCGLKICWILRKLWAGMCGCVLIVVSTVSTNIAFNVLHALIFVSIVLTNKIPYSIHNSIALILCIDHLDMPFNVHTTDKMTMITVSGFLTIYFEVGLTVIQTLIRSEL